MQIRQFIKENSRIIRFCFFLFVIGIFVVGTGWRERYNNQRIKSLESTINELSKQNQRFESNNQNLENDTNRLRKLLNSERAINQKFGNEIKELQEFSKFETKEIQSAIERVERIKKLYNEIRKKEKKEE